MSEQMHEWEFVASDLYGDKTREVTTSRMRVPGGWLYEVSAYVRTRRDDPLGPFFGDWTHESTSVVFVPDGAAR